jgi:hypothetical protein
MYMHANPGFPTRIQEILPETRVVHHFHPAGAPGWRHLLEDLLDPVLAFEQIDAMT